ncbi:MAG TPA: cupredoxin domain-containing protein [Gemmatimonadales bacterium]|nr:cupredoxin domain-containing protein [Gemmatimonadales bacterium]
MGPPSSPAVPSAWAPGSIRHAAGLASLVGMLTGCFSDRPATAPEPPASGDAVSIQNFAFVPPNLSVVSGTTVTWTNQDAVQHTVSSDDGHSFDSSAFGHGQTFQFTAGAPGTYTYTCRIHPFMHGTVTVTAP